MDETQEISVVEVLTSICAQLQGMRAEIRAMRLEAQDERGVITAGDTDEMLTAQMEADEIAGLFADMPEVDAGNGAQA